MSLIAIDPGINGAGIAAFEGQDLTWATYVANNIGNKVNVLARARALSERLVQAVPSRLAHTGPCVIVCEFPQIYTWGKGKGDPNDLLPLAAVLGGFVALQHAAEIVVVSPHAWKGNIDGDVMVERIQERVTPYEKARVLLPSAKSLQHNVWDAIGIGLHHLHRLERKRIYAR